MTRSTLVQASALCFLLLLALAPATRAGATDVTQLVGKCANCHGKEGASTESDVPVIGGYSAPYIVDSMTDYRNKERPCPETKFRSGDQKGEKTDMCKVAADLGDADIAALGKYFAAKPFVRARQPFDAALAKKGKSIHDLSCEKCHSEGGSVADDDSGILAGQWMPYLKEAFKEFTSGDRPMPKKMKPKMNKLEPADIDELVNYYGSLQ